MSIDAERPDFQVRPTSSTRFRRELDSVDDRDIFAANAPHWPVARSLRISLALTATLAWSLVALANEAGPPNIVVIVADDLGYHDLGFQGGTDIQTPNLDRLAASGTRCSSGYVSCPVCSPTRAGLMTGRYQQRFGHELNPGNISQSSEQFGLPLDQKVMPAILKQGGYETAMVGKWHLGYRLPYQPLNRGFDTFTGFLGGAHAYLIPEPNPARRREGDPITRNGEPIENVPYLTDLFGDEASARIRAQRTKPLFLYLTFNAVHNPPQVTDKYLSRFTSISDKRRQTYAAMLSAMDDAVGKVMKAIDDSGKGDNTLVFFISDNGGPTKGNASNNAPLSGDKATVWEGGIRVPFVVRWPGKVPAGKVYDQPVIALDILPTALAAAGTSVPPGTTLDGVDLVPYLRGEAKGIPHQALFWRFGDQWAIRKGDWKLAQQRNGDRGLFNLASDLAESTNLLTKEPDKARELEAVWKEWNAQLIEPKWRGRQDAAKNDKAQRRALKKAKKAKQSNPSDS